MLHHVLVLVLAAIVAAPVIAQSPAGWKVRVDRSQNAQDPDNTPNLKFASMGKGFHVQGGPAGTFWHPSNNAAGSYTAKATFNLMEPSNHTNYYGLIFGGSQLDGAAQNYTYFLVAQDGTYLVKHRNGENVQDIRPSTPHAAVRKPDAKGQSANTLEVRVSGNDVSYVVNGTVVHTTPKSGLTAKTDGLVGVRVNHVLNVHVEGFEVQKN